LLPKCDFFAIAGPDAPLDGKEDKPDRIDITVHLWDRNEMVTFRCVYCHFDTVGVASYCSQNEEMIDSIAWETF
jgi:hypothetical protein